MKYIFILLKTLVACALLLLGLSGCSSSKWNSDYNLNQAQLKKSTKTNTLAATEGDTTKPSIENNFKEDEDAGQEKKKKKNVTLDSNNDRNTT